MAATVFRHVLKNFTYSLHYSKRLNLKNAVCLQGVRCLYSAQFLGLDKYREQRERAIAQFGPMKEKFRAKMLQYLSSEGHAMVFTEDLKNMVYLAEDNGEDLDICVRMMKRFNQQNKELRFGTFVFGPVAMRLFYHLQKPDIVASILKDKELDGFFDQLSSYHIATDLLFVHQRYQDVLDIYEILKEKQLYGSRFPRDCVVLVLASCYKLNTPESLNHALSIIRSAREVGANVLRKGIAFVSALALKQNDPKISMELLALTTQLNYITVRNLRLMALCELDRLDDVFPILRSVIDRDVPTQARTDGQIMQETIDRIKAAVDRQGNKETAHIFEQIYRALHDNNHITQSSLDELLCMPVLSRPVARDRDWSSSGGIGSSAFQPPRRPGSSMVVPLGAPFKTPPTFMLRQRQGITDPDPDE